MNTPIKYKFQEKCSFFIVFVRLFPQCLSAIPWVASLPQTPSAQYSYTSFLAFFTHLCFSSSLCDACLYHSPGSIFASPDNRTSASVQMTANHHRQAIPPFPNFHCALLFPFQSRPSSQYVSSSQYRQEAAKISRKTKRSSALRGAYTKHIPTGASPHTTCGGPRSPHPFSKTSYASAGANNICQLLSNEC